jgi:hypothetical protein
VAKIYYRRIIVGAMGFADVPERWQGDVRVLLRAAGREDLCEGVSEP